MDEELADWVRERAGDCCEYCQLPQAYSSTRFQIDHVIAEQHGGPTVASNLALACLADNNHKGPNLAGIDPQTGKRTWLFNPRRQNGPGTSVGRDPSSSVAHRSVGRRSRCWPSIYPIASLNVQSSSRKEFFRPRVPKPAWIPALFGDFRPLSENQGHSSQILVG